MPVTINPRDPANFCEGPVFLLTGDDGASLPANTVAAIADGGDWASTWEELGFTTPDGVKINLGQNWQAIQTAQQRNAAGHIRGTAQDTISATLLEASLANILTAMGQGTIATTAPVAGSPGTYGQSEWTNDEGTLTPIAVGIEGYGVQGFLRRGLLSSAICTSNVTLDMRIGQVTSIPFMAEAYGNAKFKQREIYPPSAA